MSKKYKVGQFIGIILGLVIGGVAVDYILGVKMKPQQSPNYIYSP